VTFAFIVENGQVKALKQTDPGSEYLFPRVASR
jgi:hypothetical protein